MDRATLVPAAVVTVLVVIAFWVLPAIASSIDVDDPIRGGDVVQIGATVEFVPATGWDLESGVRQGGAKVTGEYPDSAVLTSGGLKFEVITDTYDGTAAQLLKQVEKNNAQVKDTAFRVTGSPTTIESTDGDRGVIATFSSATVEGFLGAYVFDGVGVEIVAVGPSDVDNQQQLARDIDNMMTSVSPVAEGDAS